MELYQIQNVTFNNLVEKFDFYNVEKSLRDITDVLAVYRTLHWPTTEKL